MLLVPRYLSIAKRCVDPSLISLMQRWEFMHKRLAIIDKISIFRMVVSATTTDVDLLYVMNHLFLQQCCGMRKSLNCTTSNELNAKNIVHAMLIRRNIYIHLANTFPKCADAIEPYSCFTFYKAKGIDINGTPLAGFDAVDADADGGDDDGDDDAVAPPSGPTSVQQSRQMLIKLCDGLTKGLFERTLIKMSKDTVGNNLDLTTLSAKSIRDTLAAVQTLYSVDYAEVAANKPSVVVHASGGTDVSVQVIADALTEITYKEKVAAWEQIVKKYEDQRCDSYLATHMLGYVVDAMDNAPRVAKKVKMLMDSAGCGKGTKRKLFLHDDLAEKPVDWPKAKRERKSVLNGSTFVKLRSPDLDCLVEIYDVCKDDADGQDVIAVITSGPPANTVVDKNVMVAHKRLKDLTPRHQKPKIGSIEISSTDVLQRVKSKNAFCGQNEHRVVFTTQSKTKIQRKPFCTTKADSYFNKWPVSAIPFGQLARTSMAKFTKMIDDSKTLGTDEHADSDCEDVPMLADELSLGDDEVIPFPFELNSQMGHEMMNALDTDVLVLINPGSGQMLKGVFALHRWAICVCRTATQKNLVHTELQKWVKSMNLVSFADKPAKPDDILQ